MSIGSPEKLRSPSFPPSAESRKLRCPRWWSPDNDVIDEEGLWGVFRSPRMPSIMAAEPEDGGLPVPAEGLEDEEPPPSWRSLWRCCRTEQSRAAIWSMGLGKGKGGKEAGGPPLGKPGCGGWWGGKPAPTAAREFTAAKAPG